MSNFTTHRKAMIFAAGRGTRLKPVTDHTPKALVKIGGKEMLLRVIEKLLETGVTSFVINIHHHAEQVRRFVENLDLPGATFRISDESDALLDTGGGLKKASPLLESDQPIFLHNADVLSTVDLSRMWDHHQRNQALATLAVSNRKSSRYFLWEDQVLKGWENEKSGERIMAGEINAGNVKKLAFSGIHLVSPELLRLLPEEKSFSITDVYLRLASHHKIVCYEHNPKGWIDIGTPEKLLNAGQMIRKESPEP